MKQISVGVLVTLFVGCASMGGTETDNPAASVRDFASSECKNGAGDGLRQALVLAADAEGLQCVEWEKTDGDALQLHLRNFPEPCGEDYRATTSERDGSLGITIHKESCTVARCGSCIFDFDFRLSGVDTDHDLPLSFGSAACASKPATFEEELTLPLEQQDSGVVCRYVDRSALVQFGLARGLCGERNMPCGDCLDQSSTTCAAGLTCTELGSGDARCLAACETDADCAGGLTTCQDGQCRSNVTW